MKKLITTLSILLITTASYAKTYTIDRVIDCNTIKLTGGERIRLIAVDCPESRPNYKAKQDSKKTGRDLEAILKIGKEAIDFMVELAKKGAQVELEFDDQKRHKSGALLAYVYVNIDRKKYRTSRATISAHFELSPNDKLSIFLNASLIKKGFVTSMTIPPNSKHAGLFKKLHTDALFNRRGLWNIDCLITDACTSINCAIFDYSGQSGYRPECVDRVCKCMLWMGRKKGIRSAKAIKSAVSFLKKHRLSWGKPIGTRRTDRMVSNGILWFVVEFKQEKNKERYILVDPETGKAEFPKK